MTFTDGREQLRQRHFERSGELFGVLLIDVVTLADGDHGCVGDTRSAAQLSGRQLIFAQIIVNADVAGVFRIEPHAALGKVGVERAQMRRLYLAELDVTDRGVDARQQALIPGVGARPQIVFAVFHPYLGELGKADVFVEHLPLQTAFLKQRGLPLHFLLDLLSGHVRLRLPCHGFADLLAGHIVAAGHNEAVGIIPLFDGCQFFHLLLYLLFFPLTSCIFSLLTPRDAVICTLWLLRQMGSHHSQNH